jgi:hypothetical protein
MAGQAVGKRFSSPGFAVLGGALLVYSIDRVLDLWAEGPTWRVGLYVVIGAAALGALIAGLRKPGPLPDMSAPWVAEAKQCMADGDKIGAIKIVRVNTRLGLAEAKRLVESWSDTAHL